jgi:pentafunctional AROM polypeptide
MKSNFEASYIIKTQTITKIHFINDRKNTFQKLTYSKYLIVTEKQILNKYTSYLNSQFDDIFLVNEGDFYKNTDTVNSIIQYMLSKGYDKSSCIIGFGGGKITDLVGYVASIYLRGIANLSIPTTLLSMVDASVGGKTGINDFIYGKNLIGTIYQPNLIIINLWMIEELPDDLLSDGLAEIIKGFALFDKEMFGEMLIYDLNSLKKKPEMLEKIVRKAIDYKIKIIEVDSFDKGLRNSLNFGHTLGHAIESVEAFNISHGKSVAIGMMLEIEIACNMGLTTKETLYKMKKCLENYNLPTEIPEYIDTYSIIEKIKTDKKNSYNKPKIIVIKEIGELDTKVTTSLDYIDITKFLSKKVFIEHIDYKGPSQVINLKGSKSICNRALILSTLGNGEVTLRNFLFSDDTNIMIKALQQLGVDITIIDDSTVKVKGTSGSLCNINTSIYVENAGTAARFLTTFCTVFRNSSITIDGNHRMRERPIDELLEVFHNTDIKIEFIHNDNRMPFRIITGDVFKGGNINIKSKNSSQFVSSLLLSAPLFNEDTIINLVDVNDNDLPVSFQYIDMTIKMMKIWGLDVTMERFNKFIVKKNKYINPESYYIEPDASTANYYLAFIALHGGEVIISGLGNSSIQGDSRFIDFLAKLDKDKYIIHQSNSETKLIVTNKEVKCLSFKEDLSIITDSFLAFGIICSQISGEYTFQGLANQAIKECNRLELFCLNMNKLGIDCYPTNDGIYIDSRKPKHSNLSFIEILTSDDHRMAMSFAILGTYLKNTKLYIDNKRCVNKTYTEFWSDFEKYFGLVYTTDQFDISKSIFNFYNKNYRNSLVILIGMRSCGKTTFGRLASKKLDLKFLDLDEYILQNNPGYNSIKQLVEEIGWVEFRNLEIKTFRSIISESYKFAGYIIACGGGIVENEELLICLKAQELVIFIDTELDSIKQVMEYKEKEVPNYDKGLEEVYEARLTKYKYCAKYIFKTPKISLDDLNSNYNQLVTKIGDIFSQFIYLTCNSMNYPLPTENSYFLSILYEDNLINELNSKDYNAIEFRADKYIQTLYDMNCSEGEIIQQVVQAIMNIKYIDKAMYNPIIFTLKSIENGGYFKGTLVQINNMYLKLMNYGIEFFDIDYNIDNIAFIANLRSNCHNSRIILSKHYLDDIDINIIKRDIYTMGLLNVDIIKIITNVNDANKYSKIKNYILITIKQPLIHFQLGDFNKITRVNNKFLTPVYDKVICKATGSGQMTIDEIRKINSILNYNKNKFYYVLGDSVTKSLSPDTYAFAFAYYNTIYKFDRKNCNNEEFFKTLHHIDTILASITMPFKNLLFINLCNSYIISEEAKVMQAINTVKKINDKLYCFNTDWIGNYEILIDIIAFVNIPLSDINVLVLGAGGAADAILFSLSELNIPKTSITVLNRTKEKSQRLASKYSIQTELNDLKAHIVISTIPSLCEPEFFDIILDHIDDGTYCVDLAYSIDESSILETTFRKVTSLITNNYISGIEFLLRQAFYSFEIFSGHVCPRSYVREQIYSKFK